MNIDRRKFPLIAQIQNRQLNLPLTHDEFKLFCPFLKIAERIITSKPHVDYLCKAQVENVLSMQTDCLRDDLYETQGVLLTESASYVYQVNKQRDGSVEGDIFFYASHQLRVYFKFEVEGNLIHYTAIGQWVNEQTANNLIGQIMSFLLFKKHVKIQKKVISTKVSRTCKTTTGKVKTDFKYPINVIDSYFFTDYINVLKTTVRPHKRHYKSGKVAEIEGHERSGYKRRAKKLSIAA